MEEEEGFLGVRRRGVGAGRGGGRPRLVLASPAYPSDLNFKRLSLTSSVFSVFHKLLYSFQALFTSVMINLFEGLFV